MKVAIVHELLTVKGGAERVARVLAGMYPQADIFTLLYDERKLGAWFPKERVHASRLQRFAKLTGLFNHHLYLPFFRGAVEAWDFSGYDLIVSSSSAFVHGLRVPKGATHVCYVHAPARYLWDQTIPVQKRMSAPARFFASRLFHRLRTWDASVADRPTALAAASETIRRRIKLYWGRGSTIVHPPIDDRWSSAVPQHANREHPDYVLIVSTLARYKNIDIAIEACNAAGSHLIIVGDGPDRARLEKMAGPTVHFYGYREGDELRNLYGDARAVIVPGDEDFNLVAVEAMACGTPVIALRAGGPRETIVEGVTGTFFDDPTAASLGAVLRDFDRNAYSANACRDRAKQFTRARFEQQMYTLIEAALSATANASR
jgi:glycosyltransferase involved in cell wall biosynthesis